MNNMSLSEKITYSTVRIISKYSDGTIGSGTGFIVNLLRDEEKGTVYPAIITNNHVVENSVETAFDFCKADENGNPIDTSSFTVVINNGNGWFSHPNKNIDLSFLPLKVILEEISNKRERIYYAALDTDLIADDSFLSSLNAIEDVIMVGYPQGIMDTYNHKPIIRRGITATHPKNDYMGKPEILLDIAAYPGSSGSPVFLLNEGSYHNGNTLNVGTRIKLIGILYAGPQYTAIGEIKFYSLPLRPVPAINIPFNLGIAIKAKEIFEIEKYIISETEKMGKNNG
ncbi:MAG: trypsin-like peptidase domain-containing protein [Anaerolineaceae bacterium]|nr:trypsin-like peptidase domain-containing protein [Anaerolineaceae bacterium]